jgi:hypothetical protein
VLLELRRDAGELLVQLSAKGIHHSNDRNRDAGGIRPYSMAIAPDSFFRNAKNFNICTPSWVAS